MSNFFHNNTTNSVKVPHIQINFGDYSDFQKTENALGQIRRTGSGKYLFDKIKRATTEEKQLVIVTTKTDHTNNTAMLTRSQCERYRVSTEISDRNHRNAVRVLASPVELGRPNEGVKPIIIFNPEESFGIDNDGYPVHVNHGEYASANLMHELVHAYHNMNGTSYNSRPEEVRTHGSLQKMEEERAIGINGFEYEAASENMFRAEAGFRLRGHYFPRQNS